jgi:hypothetical protein
LNRYERKPGEESPIGLILCAGKRHETIELLELEKAVFKSHPIGLKHFPRQN